VDRNQPADDGELAASLHAVQWREVLPPLLVWRAIRVALRWRLLLLGWLTLVLVPLGWRGIDRLAGRLEPCGPAFSAYGAPAADALAAAGLGGGSGRAAPWTQPLAAAPSVRAWGWLLHPLFRWAAGSGGPRRTSDLLAVVWSLGVWAVMGGVAARTAALELVGAPRPARGDALRHARRRSLPPFAAALGILLLTIALAAALVAVGWAARRPVGLLVVGGAWAAALGLGALLLAVAGGLVVGGPVLWAACAVERRDALDALSRTYAYIYQRPMHFAVYAAVAAVLGWGADIVLRGGLQAALAVTQHFVQWGAGGGFPAETGGAARIGASAVRGWSAGFYALGDAFALAYLAASSVAVYLLLRQAVDGVDLCEASIDWEPAAPNAE